jgi:hypothetical protein
MIITVQQSEWDKLEDKIRQLRQALYRAYLDIGWRPNQADKMVRDIETDQRRQ